MTKETQPQLLMESAVWLEQARDYFVAVNRRYAQLTNLVFTFCNPFTASLEMLRPETQIRCPPTPDNSWLVWEKQLADSISALLDGWCEFRVKTNELMFAAVYGSHWIEAWTGGGLTSPTQPAARDEIPTTDQTALTAGGYVAGVIRTMVFIAGADQAVQKRELIFAEKIINANKRMQKIKPEEYVNLVKAQARLLKLDETQALETLPSLFIRISDRKSALRIAECIIKADLVTEDRARLEKLKTALGLTS